MPTLVAYRVLPGRVDRTGRVVCRAVKVGEASRFEGSMPQYVRPGGTEAAAFSPVSGDLGDRGRRVEFWRVGPLARLGGVTLKDSIGLGGWLPGRRVFAVFERPGPPPSELRLDFRTREPLSISKSLGYATRVLSPEGKTLAYLPRTLKIVGAPTPGSLLAVRHSMPDAEIELAEHEGDPARMARAIAAGRVRFVRLDSKYHPQCVVSWRQASRLLLGPRGDLRSLAVVASPSARILGYARNWAFIRMGVLGSKKDSAYGWVYDQLGYPVSKARYVRTDGEVTDGDYAVGPDGSLLIGDNAWKGELSCVAVSPHGQRHFLIQGVGTGPATAFWGR